jgi:formamidopyrimidine-DNA glycosylase
MPELPEVNTMVQCLRQKVLNRTIVDVWTDENNKIIKKPEKFADFKEQIIGGKIENITRKGKVIIFTLLNNNKTLLVHPKMTGHFLVSRWFHTKEGLKPRHKGPMEDPMNQFIHLIFYLDNEEMIGFSDLRKFGRVELWDTDKLDQAEMITKIGIDALSPELTLEKFQQIIKSAGKKKIKQALMNQESIAGIGNIYSDEILFQAGVHPLRSAQGLEDYEIKALYGAREKILGHALALSGSSISDFRKADGTKGDYQKEAKVYRREGEKCFKCSAKIQRQKLGSRSTYYCPSCQG